MSKKSQSEVKQALSTKADKAKSAVKGEVKIPTDKTATPIELSTLTGWHEFASDAVRKKHWEWFVIDQFLRGNHNVRGNPNDNTITITKRTDQINYPINKIYVAMRTVRGFVTRNAPTIEVDPDDPSNQESVTYSQQAKAILLRDNKVNNYDKINREWTYYGIKYGVGYRQIGYDQTQQCAIRFTIDPFDLLIGAKRGEFQDAPFLIKDVVRTIGYWKNKYPNKDVAADNMLASDEYKRLSLQIANNDAQQATNSENEQTAIGHECWYRVFSANSKGGYINKVIYVDTGILDFEETAFEDYPFVPYYSEILPGELFPDGALKQSISPQRMLNLLETQMLEYNHLVNRGRFLKDKNAGFKVIYAKEGQIIEKNPGKMVQVLNPPGTNPSLPAQIQRANTYIEDMTGQHQASLGGYTVGGVHAGYAIQAIQTADANNILDYRSNFEHALAEEAEWILKMYSLYEGQGVVAYNNDESGKPQPFMAVGGAAYAAAGQKVPEKKYSEDNSNYLSVAKILTDHNVTASITPPLGDNKKDQLDLLLQLVPLGLPLKVVLEMIEFPNTPDVMQRIAEESLAEMAMGQMPPPQQPGAGIDPQTGQPMQQPGQAAQAPEVQQAQQQMQQMKQQQLMDQMKKHVETAKGHAQNAKEQVDKAKQGRMEALQQIRNAVLKKKGQSNGQ